MAIVVKFYKFAKRSNSTAIPSPNPNNIVNCVLKNATSYVNPTLILHVQTATLDPTFLNYAQIPEFSRYYWVDDWAYYQGVWECRLTIDPLASWRQEIGDSTQYVLRSASKWDGNILDGAYPAIAAVTETLNRVSPIPWRASIGDEGVYSVGIISKEFGSIGAVKYYLFDESGMNDFLDNLMGNTEWLGSDFGDISEDVIKTISNPFEYIVSCNWFPFEPSWAVWQPKNVELGWYELYCPRVAVMAHPIHSLSFSVPIPQHPQSNRGAYLNTSPYADYVFVSGIFGEVNIAGKYIKGSSTLNGVVDVDLISGESWLRLSTNVFPEFLIASGQMSMQVQLAQFTSDLKVKTASSLVDIGQSLGQTVLGWLGFDTAGVENPINIPDVQNMSSGGSNGSIVGFYEAPYLRSTFTHIVPENLEDAGRPLCQRVAVNTLSGYLRCSDPDIAIHGTKQEIDLIKQYMLDGFYYE